MRPYCQKKKEKKRKMEFSPLSFLLGDSSKKALTGCLSLHLGLLSFQTVKK
jgi:hypothetical protein